MAFYKMHFKTCNAMAHHILKMFIHRTDFSSLQSIFANAWHMWHSALCSYFMLDLLVIKDKYIEIYNEFILQL